MPFRFSLQAVLRLRLSLEKREQLRLQTIVRELAQVRQRSEVLKQEDLIANRRMADVMTNAITGAELHFEADCAAGRCRAQEELQREIKALEELRSAQQLKVQVARQQREILESLRQRQYDVYRQLQSRHDQQRLDELFLFSRLACKDR